MPPARDRRPPNVLLICVDDMNPWLGCLRDQPWCHPQVQTPHLDQLAAAGTIFTHAHAAAPLCNPARTAMLTGLHPTVSGVYGNYTWWRPHLPAVRTLPELSRDNGYEAAGAGKLFHHCVGFNPPDQWDEYRDQVFDDLWDRQSRVNYPHLTPQAPPAWHPRHGLKPFLHEFDWGTLPMAESDFGDQRVGDFAEEFLARSHERPFFLGCGLFHPHLPWYAPQRFFDRYDPQKVEVPADGREADWSRLSTKARQLAALGPQDQDQLGILRRAGALSTAVRAYLANLSFADEMIGRILRALERSAYANETVVVLAGDHGFHLGEKRHFGKRTLWRESTQVPLIIKGPGILAGRRVAEAVSTVDLVPTISELAGWGEPSRHARSLVRHLRGENTTAPPPVPVLCSLDERNHAVVTRDHRYIKYDDGSEELYDLRVDPLELNNCAHEASRSGIIETLRAALPQNPAPAAPGLDAYEFDWRSYRWRSAP